MTFRTALLATVALLLPVGAWAQTALQGSIGSTTPFLSTGGTSPRSPADRAADYVNVLDHIPVGGGTPAQISSADGFADGAFVAAESLGPILVPCGSYVLQYTFTITHYGIQGMGKGCVTIYCFPSASDAIVMGSSSVTTSSLKISDVTIKPYITSHTTGGMIHVVNTHSPEINRVLIDQYGSFTPYDGVIMDGGASQFNSRIAKFEINHASHAGINILGAPQDVFIDDGLLGSNADGVLTTSVSGLYIKGVSAIASTGSGFHFSPSSASGGTASFTASSSSVALMTASAPASGAYKVGQMITGTYLPVGTMISSFGTGTGGAGTYNLSTPVYIGTIGAEAVTATENIAGVYVTNALSDTSTNANWLFDNGGHIADFVGSNLWGASSVTDAGFALRNAALNGFNCSTCLSLNNWGHGWDIAQGNAIEIVSSAAEFNARANTGAYDGFNIGPSANHVTVATSRSGSFGTLINAPGLVDYQRYGLYAGTGTGDARTIRVIGLDTYGNVTGGVQMPTGSAVQSIGN